ncbi:MAG: hypothetical protein KKG09_05780 [Verrucomicrobia bacterium]|nr:hypothetical protein [Verrucomicrobiota bacterium]MCG2681500.1 hypothetical protein [Kiritimatiellia bacterium]MBU4248264.1 hypothetical protein [Verrucomicrobiota bacterium]MBU4289880.1 hypothetical protein [Verrucomicrobiota bacterium]MBU4428179.1 hypothetical protein [Verrucomicrobiota bacterium]
MNHRERFYNLMRFKPVDRLPVVEWAAYWKLTVDRWKQEGLPADITDPAAIRKYFGLDPYYQLWVPCPIPDSLQDRDEGQRLVKDMASYRQILPQLYPTPALDSNTVKQLEGWAVQHRKGDCVVWLTLEGFFWFPRRLFGIEEHLYAFYDQPELMHTINRDLAAYNLRVLDEFCAVLRPDFMSFAEDMSYNHGPMISRELFDNFMAPYYRRIVPALRERDIVCFIDSDGLIDNLIPWYAEVDVDGFFPLERQAGVDLACLRQRHPRVRFLGGFDKMVMHKGEAEIRREFERLLPVMRQGGFLVSMDHQTPPAVSISTYRLFVQLLQEYCGKAVH